MATGNPLANNPTTKSPADKRKKINLALQGGGAHGAFTWGVLDHFLDDDRFDIVGISGTSAGAMNAVALAAGYHEDGPVGARIRLKTFWEAIGDAGRLSPIQRTPLDVWLGNWSLDYSPTLAVMDTVSRTFSPYDTNPFDINPLRDIVAKEVDFSHVNACKAVQLFIAATNVWTGKVRVFHNQEIDLDAVMASACLPHLFKAVEIDGVPYWDGGYMGNPVLFPFFYETNCADVVLVQINPLERRETPRSAREIADRIDEINFNSSLMQEFRAMEFVSRLIDKGVLDEEEYVKVRMHRVAAEHELNALTASSKLNAEPGFINYLYDLGRAAAEAWFAENADKIGVESSVNLSEEIAYSVDGKHKEGPDISKSQTHASRHATMNNLPKPSDAWLRK